MSKWVSFFDLFSVGIGPSSSHTVGPMRAAKLFREKLIGTGLSSRVSGIRVKLYGSLAMTGLGHGTPKAILLGLNGHDPEQVKGTSMPEPMVQLSNGHAVNFDQEKDIVYERAKLLPKHSNGMQFMAYDGASDLVFAQQCYSIGGGFLLADGEEHVALGPAVPHPFATGTEMLQMCKVQGMSIAALVWANELSMRSESELRDRVQRIWSVMKNSIERGLKTSETILPGVLRVPRRARLLYNKAETPEDRMAAYAVAVNEENAAGGQVVTAPTNGAAGTIPAVLQSFLDAHDATSRIVEEFLLTASAIGGLYKGMASISAAEVGCQGEVGVASSMAAAGLAAIQGGTPEQVENAAEIAMEHSLGLTCDPVAGLVQIPCIERNVMGAVKAVAAARLALKGNGHVISLDTTIRAMYETGRDMSAAYKETSLGGLAKTHTEPIC